jgi:hypothetical protein
MCVFKATMVLISYGTMQNNFGTVEKYPEMIIVIVFMKVIIGWVNSYDRKVLSSIVVGTY